MPPPRRRPTVPPLSELDAPVRDRGAGADATLWKPEPADADAPRWKPEPAGQVADERAEMARRVLAERSASLTAERARAVRRRRRLAAAVVAAGVLLLAARVWLVGTGALFGAVPVHAADALAGLVLAGGLALLPGTPLRRPAAFLGVPAVLLAGTTLVQPATPTSAPAAACPAAPVRGGAGQAVTTAATPTRSGPGRAWPATGQLPAGCTVGVAGYCLGDTLPVAAGWADARWLRVEESGGPGGLVARHVSGAPAAARFLPAAAVAPVGPDVPLLPAGDCGPDPVPPPAGTHLADLVAGAGDNVAARASRAANVGFAVWVAPDPVTGAVPLLRGGPYRPLPGGAAGAGGRRDARWDHPALVRDLGPGRKPVTVAVLAVGCTAPGVPAGTAALTTYAVGAGRPTPTPTARLWADQVPGRPELRALDLDRLVAVACSPPV